MMGMEAKAQTRAALLPREQALARPGGAYGCLPFHCMYTQIAALKEPSAGLGAVEEGAEPEQVGVKG